MRYDLCGSLSIYLVVSSSCHMSIILEVFISESDLITSTRVLIKGKLCTEYKKPLRSANSRLARTTCHGTSVN